MDDLHLGRQFDDPVFPLDVIPHSHLFLLLRVVRVLKDLFDGPETFEVVVIGRVGEDGDDGLHSRYRERRMTSKLVLKP
jgi:hypothetical protein